MTTSQEPSNLSDLDVADDTKDILDRLEFYQPISKYLETPPDKRLDSALWRFVSRPKCSEMTIEILHEAYRSRACFFVYYQDSKFTIDYSISDFLESKISGALVSDPSNLYAIWYADLTRF